MEVVIADYELDVDRALFRVTKQVDRDGVLDVNEHWFPLVAVRNYAHYFGTTEVEALDFILFSPFMTEADGGETFEETVANCKARVYAGGLEELDIVHDYVLQEVEKDGQVPQTDLDVPGGSSGTVRKPGTSQQHGGRRDHPERVADGTERVLRAIRDASSARERADDGAAQEAGAGERPVPQ
jgi:hypothetical protein